MGSGPKGSKLYVCVMKGCGKPATGLKCPACIAESDRAKGGDVPAHGNVVNPPEAAVTAASTTGTGPSRGLKTPAPRAGRTAGRPSGMNKTEAAYAIHLGYRLAAGEIARFDFQPEKLRLAKATYYDPDFRVILPDGTIEFHEVKGHWEDDARVKIKVAAEVQPYKFIAVTPIPKSKGGGWSVEDF